MNHRDTEAQLVEQFRIKLCLCVSVVKFVYTKAYLKPKGRRGSRVR